MWYIFYNSHGSSEIVDEYFTLLPLNSHGEPAKDYNETLPSHLAKLCSAWGVFGGAAIIHPDDFLPLLCLVGQDYRPLPTMAKHEIVRPSEFTIVGSLFPGALSHQFECETFVIKHEPNPSLHCPEFYGILWPFNIEANIDLWNSVWGQELVQCEF